jgi:hypothetical protein
VFVREIRIKVQGSGATVGEGGEAIAMTNEVAEPESRIMPAVPWRVGFGFLLAAASFLIYAGIVFTLPQVKNDAYCCEQSSIASAVSNVVYGARIGSIYSGLFNYFIDHWQEPLQQELDGLPGTPLGALQPTIEDGNGVGYVLVTTAAFRIFGLHDWALPVVMLLLMAVSAGLFSWRFGAVLSGVVTLYFACLTVMLFTPLVWDPSNAVQIHVAGIRYFSLLTILPALHVLLDLLDRGAVPGLYRRHNTILAIQAAILVLAALVRGSAMALIAAIAAIALALVWRWRKDGRWLRCLRGKATVLGLTALALVVVIALAVPPSYIREGRFGTVIWQRVTQSVGVNPGWPFPGVREMFPCEKYIPEGIQPGWFDHNGHCMWLTYVVENGIPIGSIGNLTYSRQYETALRVAFFRILRRYPREVLITFLYYKPVYILRSMGQSLTFDFSTYSATNIGLLIAALGVLLAALIVQPPAPFRRLAWVTILCAGCAIPPLIAVWAFPYTSGDLVFFCLFLVGLALSWLLQRPQRGLLASILSR